MDLDLNRAPHMKILRVVCPYMDLDLNMKISKSLPPGLWPNPTTLNPAFQSNPATSPLSLSQSHPNFLRNSFVYDKRGKSVIIVKEETSGMGAWVEW